MNGSTNEPEISGQSIIYFFDQLISARGANTGKKIISSTKFMAKIIDEKDGFALKNDFNSSKCRKPETRQTCGVFKTKSSMDIADDTFALVNQFYLYW